MTARVSRSAHFVDELGTGIDAQDGVPELQEFERCGRGENYDVVLVTIGEDVQASLLNRSSPMTANCAMFR
ncbi:MAG: hypothetical protein DIU65_16160 [Proteobacteria bacterium]|jgi:hypothetical protein|nr:MAG: hypothetical protein DIU65_16160 [Pseudomonadota bacterium]